MNALEDDMAGEIAETTPQAPKMVKIFRLRRRVVGPVHLEAHERNGLVAGWCGLVDVIPGVDRATVPETALFHVRVCGICRRRRAAAEGA